MSEFEMFLFVVGVATGLAMATIVHIELGKRRRDEERHRLLDITTRNRSN